MTAYVEDGNRRDEIYARLIWTENGARVSAEMPSGRVVALVGETRGYFVGIKAPVVRCKGGVRVSRERPVGAR